MTTHQAVVRPTPLTGTVTAIFVVLGLIDVALAGAIGSADAPPLAVSLGVAALGLITLGALVPAARGSRSALGTVVVVRVISALLAVPAFFLSAPVWGHAGRGLRHRGHHHRPVPARPKRPRLTWVTGCRPAVGSAVRA